MVLSKPILREKANELQNVTRVGDRTDRPLANGSSLSTIAFSAETTNANRRVGPVFIRANVATGDVGETESTATTASPQAADVGPIVGGRIRVEAFDHCSTMHCDLAPIPSPTPSFPRLPGPRPGLPDSGRRVDKGSPTTVPVQAYSWRNIELNPEYWSESIWTAETAIFDDSEI